MNFFARKIEANKDTETNFFFLVSQQESSHSPPQKNQNQNSMVTVNLSSLTVAFTTLFEWLHSVNTAVYIITERHSEIDRSLIGVRERHRAHKKADTL